MSEVVVGVGELDAFLHSRRPRKVGMPLLSRILLLGLINTWYTGTQMANSPSFGINFKKSFSSPYSPFATRASFFLHLRIWNSLVLPLASEMPITPTGCGLASLCLKCSPISKCHLRSTGPGIYMRKLLRTHTYKLQLHPQHRSTNRCSCNYPHNR